MDLKFKKESIQRKTAVEGELKGGLLIRDLWTQGTGSIHNMYVVNTDATSYQSKNYKKCLEKSKKEKKNNYLDACIK